MNFKWPSNKVIHRFGSKFVSDDKWNLSIDIDSIKIRTVKLDEEWIEIVTKEAISKEEKAELLSALKAYGFGEIIEAKAKA